MYTEEAWKSFKNKYKIGQTVSGKIAHKMHFGIFIDIGEDYLCLLEIILINDLNYDLYETDEEFKIGDRVEGKVVGFTEDNKQMRITQKNWEKN